MRLTLLKCLSSFVLINLVCTQAVTAAPAPAPASAPRPAANKAIKKSGTGAPKVNSTPANIDGSSAGYRLLKEVKDKNRKIYAIKNKNSSKKPKRKKNKP